MNVYLEFCDVEKKTPFVEVRLTDLKPTSRRFPHPDGRDISDLWEGALICRVVTARGVNSNEHNDLIGWVRVAAMQAMTLDMPLHAVSRIELGGSPRGVDADNGLDFTEVQFPIRLSIKTAAWQGSAKEQEIFGFEAAFEQRFVDLLAADLTVAP